MILEEYGRVTHDYHQEKILGGARWEPLIFMVAKLIYKDGRVTLKNPLPGETPKTCFQCQLSGYQKSAESPSSQEKSHLPPIYEMRVQPANGLYIKLTFLNRYEIIEEKIEGNFPLLYLPETAYVSTFLD